MDKTEIYAHRGFSSLYPENTMSAFIAAAKTNIDGIELDVQLTKDKVPIVIHDFSLGRTTNGNGIVRETSYKEIQTLSAGQWFSKAFHNEKVPSLEEVLKWVRTTSLKLNIELKGLPDDRQILMNQVLQLIQMYSVEHQVLLSSFDHKLIKRIGEVNDEIETAVIVASALVNPAEYLANIGVKHFHFYYPLMNTEEIKDLLAKGFKVRPYTINDAKVMKSSFQIGCTGIFTDYPDIAIQIKESEFN